MRDKNETAHKRDIALLVAKKLKVNTKHEALPIVDAVFDALRDVLISEGKTVSVRTFGTFNVVTKRVKSVDGKFTKITRNVAFDPSPQLVGEEVVDNE